MEGMEEFDDVQLPLHPAWSDIERGLEELHGAIIATAQAQGVRGKLLETLKTEFKSTDIAWELVPSMPLSWIDDDGNLLPADKIDFHTIERPGCEIDLWYGSENRDDILQHSRSMEVDPETTMVALLSLQREQRKILTDFFIRKYAQEWLTREKNADDPDDAESPHEMLVIQDHIALAGLLEWGKNVVDKTISLPEGQPEFYETNLLGRRFPSVMKERRQKPGTQDDSRDQS